MESDIKGLIRQELIGKTLEVPLTGTIGKIIDETKYCFEILTDKNHRKKVIKNQRLIIFHQGKKIEIDGKKIEKRPEDRLKK